MHFLMPLVRDKNSSTEYVEFLKLLDDKYPKEDKIRIVLDNLKVHTSEATRKYLATVPERFEFVFTPKHGSWLNMVEGFFSKTTRQMLRGIRRGTGHHAAHHYHADWRDGSDHGSAQAKPLSGDSTGNDTEQYRI